MSASKEKTSVLVGFAVAVALWYFVFEIGYLDGFWLRISLASLALAMYASVLCREWPLSALSIEASSLLKGVLSGVLLYAAFYIGYFSLKPLLNEGARSVYVLGADTPFFVVVPTLILTSFCEEYFWRRYVQGRLVKYYGWLGLILTPLAYSIIHISTMNPPLVAAALIAGAYWGLIYYKTGSFSVVVWSHIVWTELIFVFIPLA